ncbi:MFS transporter [Alcaligenes phenolicus]|uniref:MFS transporter n=1 Tax=Alcaligenes TaxID=507 RepID=UPI002AA4F45F|nr:MFS transporter [Alcaligenes phenolicus]MDK7585104.1 MFS transporter [Alcaligenes phenolicus]
MLEVLKNRTYRHLFLAQVVALLGTGMATVALGLLAFDLAGASAGEVLGIALSLKMVAYIFIAPMAAALAERAPRRHLLVALDLVRAGVAVLLPFVNASWQIYTLIFVLQAASAAFTPIFQATIPDVLPKEEDYTRALSLSRLAYDLESVISPVLAAVLLSYITFHGLFWGTSLGFIASAALVVSVVLPIYQSQPTQTFYQRTTKGLRIYLKTPRLRGLLALNLAVAAASAMVIINTVVIVQANFGLTQNDTALALASFGLGSMIVALALPRLLDKTSDRSVMLTGAILLASGLAAGIFIHSYSQLLILWFILGLGYSLAQTPSGRLLRRSAHANDRPALFAAQFSLSHSCWLISYPLAGWLSANAGTSYAFATLAILASTAIVFSFLVWPKQDNEKLSHTHQDLPADHPHWSEHSASEGAHSHAIIIDELHDHWPDRSAR